MIVNGLSNNNHNCRGIECANALSARHFVHAKPAHESPTWQEHKQKQVSYLRRQLPKRALTHQFDMAVDSGVHDPTNDEEVPWLGDARDVSWSEDGRVIVHHPFALEPSTTFVALARVSGPSPVECRIIMLGSRVHPQYWE